MRCVDRCDAQIARSPPETSGNWAGRIEDDAFVRGLGQYTADLAADALVARFVRCSTAHARVATINLSLARNLPDVIAVFAAADLAQFLPRCPDPIDVVVNHDGTKTPVPSRPALAHDRVRFAGEAIAIVIARNDVAAADAAEAVSVDYEELPAVASLDDENHVCLIHEACPENLAFDWCGGDEAAVADAFGRASHIVRASIRVPRILGVPLEPFACLASHDATTGCSTLITPSQGVHAIRRELADGYLGVPHDALHVITPDVGGGFGVRIHALPEQAVLLAAARHVLSPLIWRADRTESNLIEPHARDFLIDAELALAADGVFMAIRGEATCSMGAYVHPGARATPTVSFLFGLQGAYKIPAVALRVRGRYTNTTPTGPFRGAGQPEGTYVLERMIDLAAFELGMSATDLRHKNALGAGDETYKAATGHVVERCNAQKPLGHAAAWLHATRSSVSLPYNGEGLALYLKVNGMGRQERSRVTVDPDTGIVHVSIGSQTNGQGHTTTFGSLAAERLGLALKDIDVLQGDTSRIAFGTGTGASSALATTGMGVARSCADLLAKARLAAASHFACNASELVYEAGAFSIAGTNRFITLQGLAALASEELAGTSDVGVHLNYTVGCHACRVRIDPGTGIVDISDYAAFDDLGLLLQPMIAAGQIHGGIANGIGQALQEGVIYSGDNAQPMTVTFLDYQVPRADDIPPLTLGMLQTPSPSNDLGVRGAGEAGAIASMAAVVNAVDAALGGGNDLEAPLTPERVWRALSIRSGRRASACS